MHKCWRCDEVVMKTVKVSPSANPPPHCELVLNSHLSTVDCSHHSET